MGMDGKLGEKREVVIGTAAQLKAKAVGSTNSLPPSIPLSPTLKNKDGARDPDVGH